MAVSVCILNFNTKAHLINCLTYLFRNTKNLKMEVFVTDNGSVDDSVQSVKKNFPQVHVIANPPKDSLKGWRGYNQATAQCKGKYIITLNSDILIPPNALAKMIKFLEAHKDAAAASCRQIDDKGNLDYTCSRFPHPLIEFFQSNVLAKVFKNQKLIKNYRYGSWHRDTVRMVDVISGSFFFANAALIKKVGYFDENLLLYYGENDLCLRIKKAGLSVYHNPKVTIIHLRSQSVNKLPPWQLFQITLHDMLYYYKKHFGLAWWLFLWITYRANWIYWRLQSLK